MAAVTQDQPRVLDQLVTYVHRLEAQRDNLADTIAAYRSVLAEELQDDEWFKRIRDAAEILLSLDDLEEIAKNHSLEDPFTTRAPDEVFEPEAYDVDQPED